MQNVEYNPQEADVRLGPVRQGHHQPRAVHRWEEGATYEFGDKVTGVAHPAGRLSVGGCRRTVDAMQYGVLAGYPLVNLKVTLLDGATTRLTSEMAFTIAGLAGVLKRLPHLRSR